MRADSDRSDSLHDRSRAANVPNIDNSVSDTGITAPPNDLLPNFGVDFRFMLNSCNFCYLKTQLNDELKRSRSQVDVNSKLS